MSETGQLRGDGGPEEDEEAEEEEYDEEEVTPQKIINEKPYSSSSQPQPMISSVNSRNVIQA